MSTEVEKVARKISEIATHAIGPDAEDEWFAKCTAIVESAITAAKQEGRKSALEPSFCGVAGHFRFQQNGSSCLMCQREQQIATAAKQEQEEALEFCRDLAEEELEYAKVGTGAEVALRHIARRAREALKGNNILDESLGQGDDDLDRLVREIFDVTNTPYWKDRAVLVAEMVRDYCLRRRRS